MSEVKCRNCGKDIGESEYQVKLYFHTSTFCVRCDGKRYGGNGDDDTAPRATPAEPTPALEVSGGWTPGPWTAENSPGDWGLPGAVFIRSGSEQVAVIDYRTPYCMGESSQVIDAAGRARANARIMAAAPDLLYALEELLARTERRGDAAKLLAYGKAQKALARAKGETR